MISRVWVATASAATVTLPAHRPGDVFLVFAFRDGNTTSPTKPAGFATITTTTAGTSCSITAAWRRATAIGETSGTWTNSTELMFICYRGVSTVLIPIGVSFFTSNGITNTVTYPAVALDQKVGASWLVACVGHRSIDTTINTPPAGMVRAGGHLGAAAEVAAFDSNGPQDPNWPSTDVVISGTASGWISFLIELYAEPGGFSENYKGVAARENAGIVSVTEKVK